MKLRVLAVLAALSTVRADADSDLMGLTVIDFDAMYKGECTALPAAPTDSTAAAASGSSDYAANYDEYYKDSSSPSSPDSALNTALCDCLVSSGVQSAVGSSAYATAMKSFMDCVAKADTAAMKRIAKYERSLIPNSKANTTAAATTTSAADAADEAPQIVTDSVSDETVSNSNVSDSAEWPFSDLSSTLMADEAEAELEVADETESGVQMGGGVDPTDERFGHAAMYILFIGVSVLLFVCAWFVKGSLTNKWGKGGYDAVRYSSEADADDKGDIYNNNSNNGGAGDDWEDMYDHHNHREEKQKKGKFAEWNQYNAV